MSQRRHFWNGDTTDPAPAPAPSPAPTPTPAPPATIFGLTLPAGWVQTDHNSFTKPNSGVSAMTTIDGWIFTNIAYVEAATFWGQMSSQPGYSSLPPVTSVSTTVTVTGNVGG
jgi:hypothetical protein